MFRSCGKNGEEKLAKGCTGQMWRVTGERESAEKKDGERV